MGIHNRKEKKVNIFFVAKGVDPKRDSPPGLFTDVIHMPTMEELKTTIKPLSKLPVYLSITK